MSDEIERLCERLEKAATSSNDGDLRGVSLEAAAALRALQAKNEQTQAMLSAEWDVIDSVWKDRAEAAEAENERLKAEMERLQGAVALLGGRVDAQDMRDASSLDLAREWEDHCKRAEAALADARAAALEEAAETVESLWAFRTCQEFATAIRALNGEKG